MVVVAGLVLAAVDPQTSHVHCYCCDCYCGCSWSAECTAATRAARWDRCPTIRPHLQNTKTSTTAYKHSLLCVISAGVRTYRIAVNRSSYQTRLPNSDDCVSKHYLRCCLEGVTAYKVAAVDCVGAAVGTHKY
jgi:hypothetical protein